MKREHLTSEAVAALLAYYPEAEIAAGMARLQAALRLVSDRYPEVLGDVNWGAAGEYPGSATIEAAVESLIMTGYVGYRPHPPLLRLRRDKLADAPGVADVPAGPARKAAAYLREVLKETADPQTRLER